MNVALDYLESVQLCSHILRTSLSDVEIDSVDRDKTLIILVTIILLFWVTAPSIND